MKKILLIIFLVLILIPSLTRAVLVPCGGCEKVDETTGECLAKQPPCQLCHIFVLFQNIINFLLFPPPAGGGVVPVIAILMIAIGGAMFMFSAGNPSTLAQGKTILKYTAIGLIIIYGAWLIVGMIFSIIGVAQWTGLAGGWREGWFQIDCTITP